jgi:hypothetical protein
VVELQPEAIREKWLKHREKFGFTGWIVGLREDVVS